MLKFVFNIASAMGFAACGHLSMSHVMGREYCRGIELLTMFLSQLNSLSG